MLRNFNFNTFLNLPKEQRLSLPNIKPVKYRKVIHVITFYS